MSWKRNKLAVQNRHRLQRQKPIRCANLHAAVCRHICREKSKCTSPDGRLARIVAGSFIQWAKTSRKCWNTFRRVSKSRPHAYQRGDETVLDHRLAREHCFDCSLASLDP